MGGASGVGTVGRVSRAGRGSTAEQGAPSRERLECALRTEEFGVRVLVGQQGRPARILVDGGDDLEVVLEVARALVYDLGLVVERVDIPR